MPTRPRSPRAVALAALLCACSGAAVKPGTASERPSASAEPEATARKDRLAAAEPAPRVMDASRVARESTSASDEPPANEARPPQLQPLSMSGSATPGLVTAAPQRTSYALVVGVETYRDVAPAIGARGDAERFAEVMRTTLGVPDDHVHLLLDERAGKAEITKQLRWLSTSVPAGGRIYLYFSGHGAPEPSSGAAYIVPHDGDPQRLGESAIELTQLLGELEKTRAREVIAIADASFSGAGGRSLLAPGTQPPPRLEPIKPTARVALLTAGSGAQHSGPTPDGKGGLLSRHLVDALGAGQADINGDARISLAELDGWIRPRVEREAKESGREQTPTMQVGHKLGAPADFIVAWGYAR